MYFFSQLVFSNEGAFRYRAESTTCSVTGMVASLYGRYDGAAAKVWPLTRQSNNTCVRAAVTRVRKREGIERKHMHGLTGTTPGELVARSLSLCAHVRLPC